MRACRVLSEVCVKVQVASVLTLSCLTAVTQARTPRAAPRRRHLPPQAVGPRALCVAASLARPMAAPTRCIVCAQPVMAMRLLARRAVRIAR